MRSQGLTRCSYSVMTSLLKRLDRLQQGTEAESSPPMFLLLNKAEGLPPTHRAEVKNFCETRHGDRFRDVTLTSALQLNDSDDAVPLDALQTTTRQIRDALMRREPFEALISAKVRAETGTEIYRMDINGSVYEASTSSDSGLASREQLYEMVRSVSAERHVLLKRQFQRKTTQLQKEWQQTGSELDKVLKKALRESRGASDGTDAIKSKALEAIDHAKIEIIDLVREIFAGAADEIVTASDHTEKGLVSEYLERLLPVPVPVRFPRVKGRILDRTFYLISVRIDAVYKIAADHDNWNRISDIYDNLWSFLKDSTDISFESPQNEFARKLREESLGFIRDFQKEERKDCKKNGWTFHQEGSCWQLGYEDKGARDEDYEYLSSSFYPSRREEWTQDCTHVIQTEIDRLQEAIISDAQRSRSQDQEEAKELDKLQQRLSELKEHTP